LDKEERVTKKKTRKSERDGEIERDAADAFKKKKTQEDIEQPYGFKKKGGQGGDRRKVLLKKGEGKYGVKQPSYRRATHTQTKGHVRT